MRIPPEEYERIDLRAHALLAAVPLHDVWRVELPGCGIDRSIVDLRAIVSAEKLVESNPATRFLFRLRSWLGAVFGWDREPPEPLGSFLERLTPADREESLVAPGTAEGPFRVLFVSPKESISEIRNSTVHAFSVFALLGHSPGYRLYWAIYVRPVGPITSWYMRLIDPFRRAIIYPAALRHIQRAWARENAVDPA